MSPRCPEGCDALASAEQRAEDAETTCSSMVSMRDLTILDLRAALAASERERGRLRGVVESCTETLEPHATACRRAPCGCTTCIDIPRVYDSLLDALRSLHSEESKTAREEVECPS